MALLMLLCSCCPPPLNPRTEGTRICAGRPMMFTGGGGGGGGAAVVNPRYMDMSGAVALLLPGSVAKPVFPEIGLLASDCPMLVSRALEEATR